MNSGYYNTNPIFPGGSLPSGTPNQQTAPTIDQNIMGPIPGQQSYVENLLRLNIGKVGKFYMTFPDSVEWRDKIFTGVLEASGRDHLIVSDPSNGNWYILLLIYLDYVSFDEAINFNPASPVYTRLN